MTGASSGTVAVRGRMGQQLVFYLLLELAADLFQAVVLQPDERETRDVFKGRAPNPGDAVVVECDAKRVDARERAVGELGDEVVLYKDPEQ